MLIDWGLLTPALVGAQPTAYHAISSVHESHVTPLQATSTSSMGLAAADLWHSPGTFRSSHCIEGLRMGTLAMITRIWSPKPRPSGPVSSELRSTQGTDSMKTNHRGSYRQKGTAILSERESAPELLNSGVVFRFPEVLDPANLLTHHDYTVEPSREDQRKMIKKCHFGCCSPKKRIWSPRLAASPNALPHQLTSQVPGNILGGP